MSKTAAAVGLTHSTRVASTLQSQTGSAPVACADSLGSRRYASREPNPLIRVRPPGGAANQFNLVEIVIVRGVGNVHAARAPKAQRSGLTLIGRRSRSPQGSQGGYQWTARRISRFHQKRGHSPSKA